jgi:hypothetical protein
MRAKSRCVVTSLPSYGGRDKESAFCHGIFSTIKQLTVPVAVVSLRYVRALRSLRISGTESFWEI